ncbi:unnamed protein product [Meloidogyne enterolobii]|uniref:Uncharacterized protein n=1 Tax=Meloidogyne enterolobii TaxID=390850 RepID=A0ACB0Y810_MELEN
MANYSDLSVVDKKLFEGKVLSGAAKLSDLDKMQQDIIMLEEGLNRNLRILNRDLNKMNEGLDEIEKGTNEGFKAVAERVDVLGQEMVKIKESVESLKSELEARDNLEYDELRNSDANRIVNNSKRPEQIPPLPPKHNQVSGSLNRIDLATNSFGNKKDQTKNTSNNGIGTQRTSSNSELNVLGEGTSSGSHLEIFSGETASSFDNWTIRYASPPHF